MTFSKKDLIEKWAQFSFFLELSEKECKEKAKDIADALLSKLSLEDALSVSTSDLIGWGPTNEEREARGLPDFDCFCVERRENSGPFNFFRGKKGISYIFMSKADFSILLRKGSKTMKKISIEEASRCSSVWEALIKMGAHKINLDREDIISQWEDNEMGTAEDIADALLSELSIEDALLVDQEDLVGCAPTRPEGSSLSDFERLEKEGHLKSFKGKSGVSYFFSGLNERFGWE